MTTPGIQRRWKALPGEPVGDAGDAYIGYDRFGRTEAMRWIKPLDGGFDTLVNVQWGYSPASQKTWRKDLLAPASTGQDQKFNYDALYQVTERQRGVLNVNATAAGGIPAQQENFSYDETGNWKAYQQQNDGALGIDQSRMNNQSNQITQVDGSSSGISYDMNGNMLTVPTGEDINGPARRVVWDAWNRPVRVYDADDNLIAEYQYDGVGRRTTVTTGGSTRHTYYDDQWRSVEERIDGTTTAERQHVWQPSNRWELILRDRSSVNNGTLDERLYPMKDQLDPVAICDASGNVLERYTYTAFGLPTFLDVSFNPQSSSYAWNFLFHAEFQDAETGWFNYGYRYYNAALGRWLSRDPIGEEGGTNLYAFVSNDCLNAIDLLGLKKPWCCIGGTTPINPIYCCRKERQAWDASRMNRLAWESARDAAKKSLDNAKHNLNYITPLAGIFSYGGKIAEKVGEESKNILVIFTAKISDFVGELLEKIVRDREKAEPRIEALYDIFNEAYNKATEADDKARANYRSCIDQYEPFP